MQDALSKVGGKESIWLAAVITDEIKKQMASNPQAKDLAPKLEAVTGTINVANDVQTNLVIHTTDAKAAADVKKILNQVKPLLTLVAQSAGRTPPRFSAKWSTTSRSPPTRTASRSASR